MFSVVYSTLGVRYKQIDVDEVVTRIGHLVREQSYIIKGDSYHALKTQDDKKPQSARKYPSSVLKYELFQLFHVENSCFIYLRP